MPEAGRDAGESLHIKALGLARIALEVWPGMAKTAIGSITVLGAVRARAAVKAALAERMK